MQGWGMYQYSLAKFGTLHTITRVNLRLWENSGHPWRHHITPLPLQGGGSPLHFFHTPGRGGLNSASKLSRATSQITVMGYPQNLGDG